MATAKHEPVEGYDFMPPEWCGGCETCINYPVPTVCDTCSHSPEGGPLEPVTWPCGPALAAALADVCGFHQGDGCEHCADVLTRHRDRGWTDAQILADTDLYQTDFHAWADKVRERSDVRHAALARLAAEQTEETP